MRILFSIFALSVLCSCRKNDPANSPEYIGTWYSYDTTSSWFNNSNILVGINADGNGYDNWGGGYTVGKCKITKRHIKIDNHKHHILKSPHTVDTLWVPVFNTPSTVKMTLCLDGGGKGIIQWPCETVDFYKVK